MCLVPGLLLLKSSLLYLNHSLQLVSCLPFSSSIIFRYSIGATIMNIMKLACVWLKLAINKSIILSAAIITISS